MVVNVAFLAVVLKLYFVRGLAEFKIEVQNDVGPAAMEPMSRLAVTVFS